MPRSHMTRQETTTRPEAPARRKRQKNLERPQRIRQFVLRHVLRTVPLSVLERGLSVSNYAEAAALYDSGDDIFAGDGKVGGETAPDAPRDASQSAGDDAGAREREDPVPPYLRHPSLHRSLDAAYDSIYRTSVTEKIGDLFHTIFK